jgi:hypothetical protein
MTMRATYRVFRGTFASWEQLFEEAAAFATQVGPERLISISHSEDGNDGVVAVWYWEGTARGGTSRFPHPSPDPV